MLDSPFKPVVAYMGIITAVKKITAAEIVFFAYSSMLQLRVNHLKENDEEFHPPEENGEGNSTLHKVSVSYFSYTFLSILQHNTPHKTSCKLKLPIYYSTVTQGGKADHRREPKSTHPSDKEETSSVQIKDLNATT